MLPPSVLAPLPSREEGRPWARTCQSSPVLSPTRVLPVWDTHCRIACFELATVPGSQASQAKTSTGNDERGQYDNGTRPPGRRAKPCPWSGPFLHRAPGITGTLNDVPGLAAHRDRRRPDDGRSSVSGLALDGASSQIGSTVASGGCDAVHDHAGRQPGSDLRKEAALCLPRGADAGASTTGTTRRCSRSLGFPGPPRPRSAIRDRLSGFVMGR
jgi:hypothetical protein